MQFGPIASTTAVASFLLGSNSSQFKTCSADWNKSDCARFNAKSQFSGFNLEAVRNSSIARAYASGVPLWKSSRSWVKSDSGDGGCGGGVTATFLPQPPMKKSAEIMNSNRRTHGIVP